MKTFKILVDGSKVELKFKSVSMDDFNSLINTYKSNGGTVTLEESSNYQLKFDWGTVDVNFFRFDREASVIATINN